MKSQLWRSLKFLFLISTFLPMRGHAEVRVDQAPNGIVLLKGPCAEVDVTIQALMAWTSKLGEQPSQGVKVANGSLCTSEISRALPAFVLESFGFQGLTGPNCWNTTLRFHQMVSTARFSSGEELTDWMNSPLCRKLKETEHPEAGAIGAVRNQADREQHSFILITENFVFEKVGPSPTEPYQLISKRLALKEFESKLQSNEFHVDYYDCQTLSHFLGAGVEVPSDLKELSSSVTELDQRLNKLTLAIQKPTVDQLQDLSTQIQTMKIKVRSAQALHLDPHAKGEPMAWLWQSLINQLGSMQTQVYLLAKAS
jgi:hypothetical protein